MFDIHSDPFRGGSWDEGDLEDYTHSLMEAFAASPEAQAFEEQNEEIGWAYPFIEFGLSYVGETPATITVGGAEEVLYDLFPRKISVEPEAAPQIVAELRAFWRFLLRQYSLPQASRILEKALGPGAEKRLERELGNPSNFGMAKSFFMMGQKLGFDMTTQEGNAEFMRAYNAAALSRLASDDDPEPSPLPQWSPGPTSVNPPKMISAAERRAKSKERRKRLEQARRTKRR